MTMRIDPVGGMLVELEDCVRAFDKAMAETPPIACTLSASDLQDRQGAWNKLMGSGLVARDVVPGGIRLSPAPGAAAALIELIDLERECCAWIQFEVGADSVVTLTADGEGAAVLAGMYEVR
jgi:hypothetical protein